MLKNLKIVQKVQLVNILLTALVLFFLGGYYLAEKTDREMMRQYSERHVVFSLGLTMMYAQGLQTEQAVRNILLNPKDEKALNNFNKALKEFDEGFAKSLAVAKGGEEAGKLEKIRPVWDRGVELKRRISEMARGGDVSGASVLLVQEETPAWRAFKDAILTLQQEMGKVMKEQAAIVDAHRNQTFRRSLTFFGVMLVFVVVSLTILARNIKRQMGHLLDCLHDMSDGEGDLTRRISVDSQDELGEMGGLFNRAWEKLDRMVADVVVHATVVGTYAAQLMLESQKIVRGSHQIAEQAGNVATASEEMAATSNAIAQNCSMAANTSNRAHEVADNGRETVQRTINRMQAISHEVESSSTVIARLGTNSEKIAEIARTIQDIADQTNLLALNAAIEAARAGEQGRGFAVVADEVRALAERTARATREIAAMTQSIRSETSQAVAAMAHSATEVRAGVSESADSGESLANIIDQVNDVTLQVNQIAMAAEQQTTTTNEIVKNISMVSDASTAFNATAQAVSSKVQQLQTLSDDLKKATTRFKADVSPYLVLDSAKYDHVMFINRIMACLNGKESIRPESLSDHSTCGFGKWYLGEGKRLCGGSNSFNVIQEPHERFHRLAKEAVALHNRGETVVAREVMQEVEQLSVRIIDLLDKVKVEVGR